MTTIRLNNGKQSDLEEETKGSIIKFYTKYKEVEENTPHKVSVVICLKCLKRWVSVRPVKTLLKDLECPNCGKIESVIETGETIKDDEYY